MTTPPDAEAVARAERELDAAAIALAKGANATLADSERYVNARNAYREAVERRVRAECGEDTKRLDWLESQHGIIAPVANLVVKLRYDANSSDWCDVFNNVRQTIDEARAAQDHHKGGPDDGQ